MNKKDHDKLIGHIIDPVRDYSRLFASMLKKNDYDKLSSKEQRAFNRFKAMAILADYGFVSTLLDSHPGDADLFAKHRNGQEFDVRVRTRPGFWKNHINQDIYICCRGNDKYTWYFYPHDAVLQKARLSSKFEVTAAWEENGTYHFPPPISAWLAEILEPYKLTI